VITTINPHATDDITPRNVDLGATVHTPCMHINTFLIRVYGGKWMINIECRT